MADPLYPPGTLVQAIRDSSLVMTVDSVAAVLVTNPNGTQQMTSDQTQAGIWIYLCTIDPAHAPRSLRGSSSRRFREDDLAPYSGAFTQEAVAAQAAQTAASANAFKPQETVP